MLALTEKKSKLAALALDPAAPKGEFEAAAAKLVSSWRRRGVRVGDFTPTIKEPRLGMGDYTMPFGRHKGRWLRDIFLHYLLWVLRECSNRPEVQGAVRCYLRERRCL